MRSTDEKHLIHSMTGFASGESEICHQTMRLEIKTLNHRFLDIKVRLPRDFSSTEILIRTAIQSQLGRGSVEVKLEKSSNVESNEMEAPTPIQMNLALAAHYYESLITLQKTLGLTDPIRTIDVANMPEVISRSSEELQLEEAWKQLQPLLEITLGKLADMRAREGTSIRTALENNLSEIYDSSEKIKQRRSDCQASYAIKIQDKIKSIFEAHPIQDVPIKDLLESRISQELTLLLDKTDIEEELMRFRNHLDHFRTVLKSGGAVGRKLDFILQELNREINTMTNKAQDFQISEEVVKVKVRLEQLREQVMNLE
ncbi:MAG: YicC family protein [Bdellovibrionales bacterium RIFOXYD1_FULL_44_7]|nr:MAG: YicC family protein [Bdellovibrionales bacterium RIFOXYD1_FULL_44_7]